jgi:predicted small metal-binding protein
MHEGPIGRWMSRHAGRQDKGVVMREVDCPCGLTLSGADDDELLIRARAHADEHHANDDISDDFIREHVRTNARDAAVG